MFYDEVTLRNIFCLDQEYFYFLLLEVDGLKSGKHQNMLVFYILGKMQILQNIPILFFSGTSLVVVIIVIVIVDKKTYNKIKPWVYRYKTLERFFAIPWR